MYAARFRDLLLLPSPLATIQTLLHSRLVVLYGVHGDGQPVLWPLSVSAGPLPKLTARAIRLPAVNRPTADEIKLLIIEYWVRHAMLRSAALRRSLYERKLHD